MVRHPFKPSASTWCRTDGGRCLECTWPVVELLPLCLAITCLCVAASILRVVPNISRAISVPPNAWIRRLRCVKPSRQCDRTVARRSSGGPRTHLRGGRCHWLRRHRVRRALRRRMFHVATNESLQTLLFDSRHPQQTVRKLWCGGGQSSLERFDPPLEMWELMRPMLHRRVYTTIVGLRDRLYVCGGVDNASSAMNSVECYDPSTDSWAPMLHARRCAKTVRANNCLYVFGCATQGWHPEKRWLDVGGAV